MCVDHWCIVTVVGRAGHRTGTGVCGSLVHCRCGGTRGSPYWYRCVWVLRFHCGGTCRSPYWNRCVWVVHCHCGGTCRSPYWDRCVWAAGALLLWWDEQVTVLGQVCRSRWCIATVVGRAGHHTGTGVWGVIGALSLWWDKQVTVLERVWGSLVHCRCGGTSRSLYWNRCVRVVGAFSLRWGEQVTILEQVCWGQGCTVTVMRQAGDRTGTGVFGWCVGTVMGQAGHRTGTGVWGCALSL